MLFLDLDGMSFFFLISVIRMLPLTTIPPAFFQIFLNAFVFVLKDGLFMYCIMYELHEAAIPK